MVGSSAVAVRRGQEAWDKRMELFRRNNAINNVRGTLSFLAAAFAASGAFIEPITDAFNSVTGDPVLTGIVLGTAALASLDQGIAYFRNWVIRVHPEQSLVEQGYNRAMDAVYDR